jgi:hypothetical protein
MEVQVRGIVVTEILAVQYSAFSWSCQLLNMLSVHGARIDALAIWAGNDGPEVPITTAIKEAA